MSTGICPFTRFSLYSVQMGERCRNPHHLPILHTHVERKVLLTECMLFLCMPLAVLIPNSASNVYLFVLVCTVFVVFFVDFSDHFFLF